MNKNINPYALESLGELEDDEKKGLKNAIAEISASLRSEGGGPITKKGLMACMSGDTAPYFHAALRFMALNKKVYMTYKGYVSDEYELSVDEQVAHITWCLKVFEFSSRQYLMDKKILLEVPDILRRLKDKYGAELPKWRDKVLDIEKQSQMMGATLNELSEAYNVIAAAAEEMLLKPKPKKYNSLEELEELKKQMKEKPCCTNCGKSSFRQIKSHKNCYECKECGRTNWFYPDKISD